LLSWVWRPPLPPVSVVAAANSCVVTVPRGHSDADDQQARARLRGKFPHPHFCCESPLYETSEGLIERNLTRLTVVPVLDLLIQFVTVLDPRGPSAGWVPPNNARKVCFSKKPTVEQICLSFLSDIETSAQPKPPQRGAAWAVRSFRMTRSSGRKFMGFWRLARNRRGRLHRRELSSTIP